MQRIKDAFLAQKLQVPDEIITILHQEVTAHGAVPGQVEQRAIELWKNTDLRSFYLPGSRLSSSLARIVNGSTKGQQIISEPLCLQIDFLRDISRPAYQQLQKVINRFGENVLVTGDATQGPSAPGKLEEHGKRMLLLNMTDGSTNIQAMEYQSISQLSTETLPGTKVRLIPPIIFRKGMLLLKPMNVQIVGGVVSCLQTKYAQKRVLAQILNANLEQLEKSAPPCPPPNATLPPPPPPPPPTNVGGLDEFAFDADGDAFLAEVPEWGDDPEEDALLGEALDQFNAQGHQI